MRTKTRDRIIESIRRSGEVRPAALQQEMNISAQMVHRHLRKLVGQGIIEARGSPPFTQYALTGAPDLRAVAAWVSASSTAALSDDRVCATRDIFAAHLPRLKDALPHGLSPMALPLIVSAVGEVGNNSFDHNLGQWRDVPGCWFEFQITGKKLWICVADRGQGVFQSLVKVHPHLNDDQAALAAAFDTIISGRAPEQRGNGLKFVKSIIAAAPGAGVACVSGTGRVHYGNQGDRCAAQLKTSFSNVAGTVTLLLWSLQ